MIKLRTLISAYMGIIVGVLLILIIFSLGSTLYTKASYDALLSESIDKYTYAANIETTATGIKYRKEMGNSTDFEQLKLIMELKQYYSDYSNENTEDIALVKELLDEMTIENYRLNEGLDVTKIITTVQKTVKVVETSVAEHQKNLSDAMNMIFLITVAAIVVVLLAVIIICIKFSNSISNPIASITKCAKEISEGNMAVNIPDANIREIHELGESFVTLGSTINSIIEEIDKVCSDYVDGYDRYIDVEASGHKGDFLQMEERVNELLRNVTGNTDEILNCVAAFADGNFAYEVPYFAGDHAAINEKLIDCRTSFSNIIVEINHLSKAIENGELDTRLDTTGKQGDWLKVIDGLNHLAEAVNEPIVMTVNALERLADSELSYRINVNCNGKYKVIMDTINNVSSNLENIIADISRVLKGLAMNDLTVRPQIAYKGDFSEIETNVATVVTNLKALIRDMTSASEQIQMGSKSMADSSTNLAAGANQQADAVHKLLDLSNNVSTKASDNFNAASSAKEHSNKVKSEIQNGNEMLENLNESMNNIARASEAISQINAVIDEIAFQTNILALNAAVEAARAGSHGKGFAVVADEVRNLASKSQKSAQNAGEHIETTLQRVSEGVKAVSDTTTLLKTILTQTADIDAAIDNVLEISSQQRNLSSQMQEETSRINDVVNDISSASEETAATSEELASQIETFNQSIYLFKT